LSRKRELKEREDTIRRLTFGNAEVEEVNRSEMKRVTEKYSFGW